MCDIAFIVDIYVNFNLAFVDEKGLVEDRPRCVRRHYLRTWFLFDFLSTIPWDLIAYISEKLTVDSSATDANSNMKIFRMLKVIKLIKLIRVFKLVRTLGRSIGQLKGTKAFAQFITSLRFTNAMEDVMKYFFLVLMTTHWCACLGSHSSTRAVAASLKVTSQAAGTR